MKQHASTTALTSVSTAKKAHRVTKAVTGIAVAAVLAVGGLAAAAPAQAADWGGNGDPSACTNAYTVKSVPIYGSRGITQGKVIGWLELRWSSSCYANWARVLLSGGLYSSPVAVEQSVRAEGRGAGANDNLGRLPAGGTSAWTPYLRLADSRSTACVSASVSSDFGTLNYHTNGASFCV
jgi:hypothetical protein